MLREEPYGYFGTIGSVNPATREVTESEATQTKIASKKAVKTPKLPAADPQRPFTDDEFRCLPSELEGLENQKLVWCRLSQIITPKGSLFASKYFSNFTSPPRNPTFLNEVGLLPPFYYQSLFLTPDFTPSGMYRVIVNVQGQFRVVVVDDIIPVYEASMQPLWGLDREVPWELILLKVWAKVLNGFRNIYSAKPFEFLRTFTYPCWRLKNIEKYDPETAWRFLSSKVHGDSVQYNQSSRAVIHQELSHVKPIYDLRPEETNFTAIAKTKNNEQVAQCGLMPNAAAYQIVKLFEVEGKRAVKIASSIRNRWNGEFSVLDQRVNQFYDPNFHDLTLSKSFIMPFQDFRKLFGLVLMTPINYKQYLSTKHTGFTVDLPANHKRAQYYRFLLKEPGQVCFSVIQSIENMVPNIPKPPPPPQATVVTTVTQSQSRVLQGSGSMLPNQLPPPQLPPAPALISPPSIINTVINEPPRSLSGSGMSVQIPTTPIPQGLPAPTTTVVTSTMGAPPPMARVPSPMQTSIIQSPPFNPQILNQMVQPHPGPLLAQPAVMPPHYPPQTMQSRPPMPPTPMQSGMPMMPPRPPSQDPWLNTNPWGNPPTTGPQGVPGYQSNSRVMYPQISPVPPNIAASQYTSMVRPAIQDPWLNRNPWGNPPTTAGSHVGMPPMPPSALGPSRVMSPPLPMNPPFPAPPLTSTVIPPFQSGMSTIDPWKNTNPWGNPPAPNPMMRPPSNSGSRTIIQQTTTAPPPVPQMTNPVSGSVLRPGTPSNASLLLPQLTPGLPPIQPSSNYVAPLPPAPVVSLPNTSVVRPPLPQNVDPWLNQNQQSQIITRETTIVSPNMPMQPMMNPGVPPPPGVGGAPNPYAAYGAPPVNPQMRPSSVYNPGTSVYARSSSQQNPWFNTNPWSNPPTAPPPTGMRGGGGPSGIPIPMDPWKNTNPWSNPPGTNPQIPVAGYPQQYPQSYGGGTAVGGASRQYVPSPQNSQIRYEPIPRSLSPSNVPNQPPNLYMPPATNLQGAMNPNPLQPMAMSQYSYVPQDTSQIIGAPRMEVGGPGIPPPTPPPIDLGITRTTSIMQAPVPRPAPPAQNAYRPLSNYAPSVPPPEQFLATSQSGTNLFPNVNAGVGAPVKTTVVTVQNPIPSVQVPIPPIPAVQAPIIPVQAPVPSVQTTTTTIEAPVPPVQAPMMPIQAPVPPPQLNTSMLPSRSVLAGSGVDPWMNLNPWSNPPVSSVDNRQQIASPVGNFQPNTNSSSMSPIHQVDPYQRLNAVVADALTQMTNSQMARSGSQSQLTTIKPPAVQPLQPPEARRPPPIIVPTHMNGVSFGSTHINQSVVPANVSAPGYQAYVPHNSQLRFLKTKVVLARLNDGKYNIATKSRGASATFDELSEPENGYEYVDIDETHGYTAGEAYFFRLPPGEYILHVKQEACPKPTSSTMNFVSQIPIQVSPISLEKNDKSLLLRSCFLDYARERGNVSYLNPARTQWVSYGPTFNELGYGFIAFQADQMSAERLYCEFNPHKLREEGYICKDIYKHRQGDVGLFAENGLGRCIILKQINPNAVWPPRSVMIYRAQ